MKLTKITMALALGAVLAATTAMAAERLAVGNNDDGDVAISDGLLTMRQAGTPPTLSIDWARVLEAIGGPTDMGDGDVMIAFSLDTPGVTFDRGTMVFHFVSLASLSGTAQPNEDGEMAIGAHSGTLNGVAVTPESFRMPRTRQLPLQNRR